MSEPTLEEVVLRALLRHQGDDNLARVANGVCLEIEAAGLAVIRAPRQPKGPFEIDLDRAAARIAEQAERAKASRAGREG